MTEAATRATELRDAINATLKTDAISLGSDPKWKVTYLPTGVMPVDVALQGGLPRGRFTTLQGDYSTLKSYIGYRAIARTQADGGVAALMDNEHAFDPEWAAALGIDIDNLLLKQPMTGEEAVDITETLIRGGCDLIVFDSVAAALPQDEMQKRLSGERLQPGRLANLMSAAMRRLTAANDRTAVLWINQFRMNIGVTFGNPQVATGGKALPYFSSYILDVMKTGKVTQPLKSWDGEKWIDTKQQVAQKYKLTLQKSKLSRPFKEAHFIWDLRNAEIDEVGYLIGQGLEIGIITQTGASWVFDGQKVMGREKFAARMVTDHPFQQKLRDAVLTSVSPGNPEIGKAPVVLPKSTFSVSGEPEPIPEAAAAKSDSTEAPKTPSSKSRMLKK